MKRFLLPVWVVGLLLFLTCSAMAVNKMYWATSVSTGTSALSAIDGGQLAAGDVAIVITDVAGTPTGYLYRVYEDSAAESIPTVVSPATTATTKRWHLVQTLTSISALSIGAGTVSNTEFGYLDGVTSAIQTQFSGKSDTGHNHTGVYDPLGTAAGLISDLVYGAGWDNDTTHSPSKNAVYDKISTLSYSDVGAAASGHNHTGTYDPAGTAAGLISDVAYPTGWDTDTTHAPSRNAVYDAIVGLGAGNVTGPDTPTAGQLVKWGPSGKALVDGPSIGSSAGNVAAGDHTHSYQPSDQDLTDIAALSCTENQIIKRNGSGAWACGADNDTVATQASLHVDDILTSLGITSGDTHFGTFTGSTISDNQTVKAALQALETAVEGKQATDALLTALSALTFTDGSMIYFTADHTPVVFGPCTADQVIRWNSVTLRPECTSTLNIASQDLSAATSSIPWPVGTASAPTTEGAAYHNSSTDVTTIGDGAAANVLAKVAKTVIYRVDSLPIGWFIDGGTAPGALTTLTLGTNKAKYRDFSGATDNDVIFEWPVPYGIDATVAPVFQVTGWITSATAPADTETAKFTLACASYGDSEAGSGSLGTGVTVTKTFTTASAHAQYDRWTSGYSTAVTITGFGAEELVICNLKRDTTDTYAQSIGVGWIKIKYAVKLQGS